MSLALSCVILIWGICRNKSSIFMHIVAYLFIVVVNALQFMLYFGSLRAYEIATICSFVVYFVCTLIFGLILNTIVTKI